MFGVEAPPQLRDLSLLPSVGLSPTGRCVLAWTRLHPIDLAEVLGMGDAGAQVLDVREPAEYAKGHLAGSTNIGLGGQ